MMIFQSHNLLDSPRDTTKYIISGTTPFRLSSKKFLSSKIKHLEGHNYGGNRQNIEKSMREIWEADKGYVFVQCDQSGADALIVAYLCRKGKYRSLFENNVKPHTYVAMKVFSNIWKTFFSETEINECLSAPIPELIHLKIWPELNQLIKSSDDWEQGKRYYYLGKKIVHGGSYGMHEKTFVTAVFKDTNGMVNIKLEDAKEFLFGLSGFHKEFPEIGEWQRNTYITYKKTNQLRNLFGFPYNVTDYVSKDDYKDLIAWVPSSTVACITRQAFIATQQYINNHKKDWHLLHDTHDSFLMECPGEEKQEAAKIMQQNLAIEFQSPVDGEIFKMKSEAQYGWNWGPKKIGNEEGMRGF